MSKPALCVFLLLWAAVCHAQDGRLNVRLSWGHSAAARRYSLAVEAAVVSSAGHHEQAVRTQWNYRGRRARSCRRRPRRSRDRAGVPPTCCRLDNVHILDRIYRRERRRHHERRPCSTPPVQTRAALTVNSRGRNASFKSESTWLSEKAVWIPALDMYVTAGDVPQSFDAHMKALAPRKGQRMLDRLRAEPEATYADYTARWEDMGRPAYTKPQTRGPGHIVGRTWDSAIRKFGVDRGGGVWSDEGNPDKLRFGFAFAETGKGIARTWKGQRWPTAARE